MEISSGREDDVPLNGKKECCCDNSIKRLLSGKDLNDTSLDGAVQALALINGLIITIPYGLMSSVDSGFWDNIEAISADCPQFGFKEMQYQFYLGLRVTLYSSTAGLIVSSFYYLLKPKDLQAWWWRGRFFIIFLFLFTAVSVIALIGTSNLYMGITGFTSTTYCTSSSAKPTSALCVFLLIVLIGTIILFI